MGEEVEFVDPQEVEEIERRIASYKIGISTYSEDLDVVRRFLFHGSPYALSDDQEFRLKRRISQHWNIRPESVYIVGSAKLGFSIAPKKRYRHFGNSSDIDIAIVDHGLYQGFWHELHRHRESGEAWDRIGNFQRYAAWGWLRPDHMPMNHHSHLSKSWWDFFVGLQREDVSSGIKVAGAIYHDMTFLERYQEQSVAKCREDITLNGDFSN